MDHTAAVHVGWISDEGELLFIQLPDTLPGEPPEKEEIEAKPDLDPMAGLRAAAAPPKHPQVSTNF